LYYISFKPNKMLYALACLGKNKLKRRLSSKIIKQLHTKLKKIRSVVPSAQGWCVIDREGQFMAESSTAYGEELSNDILCLRNAAHNYGKVHATPDDISVVHIEGEKQIFSFYVGQEHVVAFFSERVATGKEEVLDFTSQDQEIRVIIDDIFYALQKN